MRIKQYCNPTEAARREHLDKWHAFHQVVDQSFEKAGSVSMRQLSLTQTEIAFDGTTAVSGTGTAFNTELQVGDNLVQAGVRYRVVSITNDTAAVVENTGAPPVGAGVSGWTVERPMSETSTCRVQVPTLDELTLKAHGIAIYNEFPSGFYNAYTALHYGGNNIKTPDDVGALMVPFNLYPGTYQPSGHINVSRAREFYLSYCSSVISSTVEGTLVVLASAINFLLISDGSAVLRYST